jgi:hypothetical protein
MHFTLGVPSALVLIEVPDCTKLHFGPEQQTNVFVFGDDDKERTLPLYLVVDCMESFDSFSPSANGLI